MAENQTETQEIDISVTPAVDVDQVVHETIRELGLCPEQHDAPWRSTLTTWRMEISEARRRSGHGD
jgi:hypothetical protein